MAAGPGQDEDFVDVQGQWYVAKHPTKQGWSRVWYSAEVALPPWLPGPIVVQLCKTSGTKALSFVKKEAEALMSSSWGRTRGASGRGLPFGRGGSEAVFRDAPSLLRTLALLLLFDGAAPSFRFFFFGAAAEAWLAANASSMLLAFAAWADS